MANVYLSNLSGPTDYDLKVRQALDWLQIARTLKPNSRVFIKPNLISREYRQGVTTSPHLVKAVIAYLKDWTSHISICESGGWLNKWTALEAMAGHGIDTVAKEYGVALVDIDQKPSVTVETLVGGRKLDLELPGILLNECDLLITLPVVKTHIFTTVSLGMKNLYGCIGHPRRLYEHPRVNEVIVALVKALKPGCVVMDGLYAMNGPGPVYGDVVSMNKIMAADSVPVGDYVGCKLMNIDPASVKHIALAMREGIIEDVDSIEYNDSVKAHAGITFEMTRGPRSQVAYLISKSKLASHAVYLSPLAGVKDKIVSIVKR